MEKKTKTVLAVLCLFVVLLAIGAMMPSKEKEGKETTPQLSVTASPEIHNNTVCLKVTVSGPKEGLNLYLNDPDKNQADWTYVSEQMMEDGVETVYLALAGAIEGIAETPKGGTYTLVIKDVLNLHTYYRENFEFTGAQLSVSSFTPNFALLFYEYYLENLSLTVVNNGDLPAYVGKIEGSIGGLPLEALIGEWVLGGESKTWDVDIIATQGLGEGTYPVTINLRTGLLGGGDILTTYSSTIQVPS